MTIDGEGQGGGAFSGVRSLRVTGRGGVPSEGVGAVILNVTAVAPITSGHVTVYPAGSSRPTASNLNFAQGVNVPVAVIAKVGDNGRINLFTSSRTDVIVDVSGWFGERSLYTGLNPARLVDTRPGRPTVDGDSAGGGAFEGVRTYEVLNRGGVPETAVGTVALTVTVTNPTAAGYVSVFPSGSGSPNTSNVNFTPGQTVSNLVVTNTRAGSISVYASSRTDVIIDVVGWLPPESDYVGLYPQRLVDTRPSRPTVDGLEAGGGSFSGERSFEIVGRGGVSTHRVGAVIVNMTAVEPNADGYTTVYPSGEARPNASNLNLRRGRNVANLVVVNIGLDGRIAVFNSSRADVIIDVVGWLPGDGIGPIDSFEADAVSVGGLNTCAVSTEGGLRCWGSNSDSQLGDQTTADSSTPIPVTGLGSGVESVSVGSDGYSCALVTGGGVKCWGANWPGQLGDGTLVARDTPVDVIGLGAGVRSISAGGDHACAVTTGGAALCWGANYSGQVGDGTTTDRSTPQVVSGLSSGVKSISAGWGHTCAVLLTSAIQCWGSNSQGQLGDGTTTDHMIPVTVSGFSTGGVMVSAGSDHSCAIDTDGGASCWGYNGEGQLGNGEFASSTTPVSVVDFLATGFTEISAGLIHTCALAVGGGVKCWGANDAGLLGTGWGGLVALPADVVGLGSGVVSINVTETHSCVVTAVGTAKCWGVNTNRQLGDRTNISRPTPVTVAGTE